MAPRTLPVALLAIAVVLPGAFPGAGAAPVPNCKGRADLDVVLVIDRSGSMAEELKTARTGATRLVRNLTADDQSGLVSYSETARLDRRLGRDHGATEAAIAGLAAGGNTATGAALDLAHKELALRGRGAARQVIVLLTDGQTNTGPDPVQQAAQAKAAGIEIYAIGLGSSIDAAELRAIASAPVAEHFHHARTVADLLEVFEAITRLLGKSDAVAEAYAARADAAAGAPAAGLQVVVHKVAQRIHPAGGSGSLEDVALDAGGLRIRARAATTSAAGSLGPMAVDAAARATVAGLEIRDATGAVLIEADLLEAAASSRATPAGRSSSAEGTRIAGLRVLGQPVEVPAEPGTALDLGPVGPAGQAGRLVLHEQLLEQSERRSQLRVHLLRLTLAQPPVAGLPADPGVEDAAAVEVIVAAAMAGAACTVPTVFAKPKAADDDLAGAALACAAPLAAACARVPGDEDVLRSPRAACLQAAGDLAAGACAALPAALPPAPLP